MEHRSRQAKTIRSATMTTLNAPLWSQKAQRQPPGNSSTLTMNATHSTQRTCSVDDPHPLQVRSMRNLSRFLTLVGCSHGRTPCLKLMETRSL